MYSRFGEDTFSFSDCRSALTIDESKARLVLSRLRRAGYIVMFEREARLRRYRVLDPSLLTFAEGVGLRDFMVHQGRYTKLILLWCRRLLDHYGPRLISIVLYGSVARGKASTLSDLDFLLVIDKLARSYGRRIDELVSLETDSVLTGEKAFLRRHGYPSLLSYLVYTPEESRAFRLLFLDIIHEGRILFDQQGYFSNLAVEYRARLKKLGARRVVMDDERWYWELKPDIKFGEHFSIGQY